MPVKVKVGLSFVLAAAIGPTLDPMPPVAPGSYAGLWMVMQQVLTGIALGFTMRIVFASVQTAGEFIGLQMGLSFASFRSRHRRQYGGAVAHAQRHRHADLPGA